MAETQKSKTPLLIAAAAVGLFFVMRGKGQSDQNKIIALTALDWGSEDERIQMQALFQTFTSEELDLFYRIATGEAVYPLSTEDDLLFEQMQIKYGVFS